MSAKCRVYEVDGDLLKARGCHDFGKKGNNIFSGQLVEINEPSDRTLRLPVGFVVSAKAEPLQYGFWYYDVSIQYDPGKARIPIGAVLTITPQHIKEAPTGSPNNNGTNAEEDQYLSHAATQRH